ncbi:MAG: hypothetical protein ACI9DJ_002504 [Algoriphagus sp.]|jgi:hypothetical protein
MVLKAQNDSFNLGDAIVIRQIETFKVTFFFMKDLTQTTKPKLRRMFLAVKNFQKKTKSLIQLMKTYYSKKT